MSQKERPEISLNSIPNLPASFLPGKYDAVFILGIANKTFPDKKIKNWPVAYKIVRWFRYSMLDGYRKTFTLDPENYPQVKQYVEESVSYIKKEKFKNRLRSVHTIMIVYDRHGKQIVKLIKV